MNFRRTALAAPLFLALPALAAPLAGVVVDGAGAPVSGALVVGSAGTDVKDPNGAIHRWIATSDAAGRFTLPDFPAGPCHVTANAGAAGVGQEAAPCDAGDAAASREARIVVAPASQRVAGRLTRAPGAKAGADDIVLFARVPTAEGPLVVYGTRPDSDSWTTALPAGTWIAKAVTPAMASAPAQFVLPGSDKPIVLNLFRSQGTKPALARALHAMVEKDQAARFASIAAGDDDKAANAAMGRIDHANLARLDAMVRRHGWPTATTIGSDGMHDFWLLVQHSSGPFIARALPHLKAAADRDELAWSELALTVDRDLVDRHLPQVYGTQATSGQDGRMTLFPVADEAHLDERRARVGLGPEAEYLSQLEKMYAPAKKQ